MRKAGIGLVLSICLLSGCDTALRANTENLNTSVETVSSSGQNSKSNHALVKEAEEIFEAVMPRKAPHYFELTSQSKHFAFFQDNLEFFKGKSNQFNDYIYDFRLPSSRWYHLKKTRLVLVQDTGNLTKVIMRSSFP